MIVRVNHRYQITLPKDVYEALGIGPGGELLGIVEGDSIRLLPKPEDWCVWIYGLGAETWASLGGGEAFLREERASWEQEHI